MMGVVGPLPPRDADTGEAIPGEDLREFVESPVNHDLIMAGVVAQVSDLHPSETQYAAGEHVDEEIVGAENAVERGEEH